MLFDICDSFAEKVSDHHEMMSRAGRLGPTNGHEPDFFSKAISNIK
jgi:hypothetical protein